MNAKVIFFKPSGKYYTSEHVDLPDRSDPWDLRGIINSYLGGRLKGMNAVVVKTPWGYPSMIPNIGECDEGPVDKTHSFLE